MFIAPKQPHYLALMASNSSSSNLPFKRMKGPEQSSLPPIPVQHRSTLPQKPGSPESALPRRPAMPRHQTGQEIFQNLKRVDFRNIKFGKPPDPTLYIEGSLSSVTLPELTDKPIPGAEDVQGIMCVSCSFILRSIASQRRVRQPFQCAS